MANYSRVGDSDVIHCHFGFHNIIMCLPYIIIYIYIYFFLLKIRLNNNNTCTTTYNTETGNAQGALLTATQLTSRMPVVETLNV